MYKKNNAGILIFIKNSDQSKLLSAYSAWIMIELICEKNSIT